MTGRSKLSFLEGLAHFLSEVLNPFTLVATLLILVAWLTDPMWGQTAFVAVLFIAVIPWLTSLVMVRLGKVTDRYILLRRQRHAFYGVSLGSMMLGAVLIFVLDTSVEARWMLSFSVFTLGAVMVINRWTKISIHALMAALSAVIFVLTFTQQWVTVLSLVAWAGVCWSRVFLSRHSLIEVLLGSALGSIVGFAFLEVVGGLPLP